MNMLFSRSSLRVLRFAAASYVGILAGPALRAAEAVPPPGVGALAPNFTLRTLDDRAVELQPLASKRPVVLVILRGWPGYQCPVCTRQVQDYIASARAFAERGATVLMIYPGPAAGLQAHAREFLDNKQWPAEFILALDPGFELTSRYGLRWDAKNETAYPSTFIIDRERRVRFAHISRSHGDRVSAARALAEWDALPR